MTKSLLEDACAPAPAAVVSAGLKPEAPLEGTIPPDPSEGTVPPDPVTTSVLAGDDGSYLEGAAAVLPTPLSRSITVAPALLPCQPGFQVLRSEGPLLLFGGTMWRRPAGRQEKTQSNK